MAIRSVIDVVSVVLKTAASTTQHLSPDSVRVPMSQEQVKPVPPKESKHTFGTTFTSVF